MDRPFPFSGKLESRVEPEEVFQRIRVDAEFMREKYSEAVSDGINGRLRGFESWGAKGASGAFYERNKSSMDPWSFKDPAF